MVPRRARAGTFPAGLASPHGGSWAIGGLGCPQGAECPPGLALSRAASVVVAQSPRLQVLSGVGHRVDGAAGLCAVLAGDQGPDVDDPLPLLAGDPRPVVRGCRVGQVLVLAELLHAGA